MAIRRFAILLLLLGVGAIASVRADEVTDAEAMLAKAREVHAEAFAKVREGGAQVIADKVKAEKKKKRPNTQLLEALKADRESLEKGVIPKWIQDKFQKQVAEANKKLIESLKEMIAAYARSDAFDKAKAIEKEIEQINNGARQRPTVVLRTGMLLKGVKVWTKEAPNTPRIGQTQEFLIEITEVESGQFKGTLKAQFISQQIPIKGNFQRDRVEWTGDGTPLETYKAVFDGRQLKGDCGNGNFTLELLGSRQ